MNKLKKGYTNLTELAAECAYSWYPPDTNFPSNKRRRREKSY